jgi:hypothetical protein
MLKIGLLTNTLSFCLGKNSGSINIPISSEKYRTYEEFVTLK